jgi:hypothetical protein
MRSPPRVKTKRRSWTECCGCSARRPPIEQLPLFDKGLRADKPRHLAKTQVRIEPRRPRTSSFVEVKSRLVSTRAVLEHEEQALSRLNDRRLLDVLVTIQDLKLELSHAIDALERVPSATNAPVENNDRPLSSRPSPLRKRPKRLGRSAVAAAR